MLLDKRQINLEGSILQGDKDTMVHFKERLALRWSDCACAQSDQRTCEAWK